MMVAAAAGQSDREDLDSLTAKLQTATSALHSRESEAALESERLKSWESRLKLDALQVEEKSRALHKDRADLEQREAALKQAQAVPLTSQPQGRRGEKCCML